MKKFAVRFGDNDFYFTLLGIGNAFLTAHTESHPKKVSFTKEQIVKIWNDLAIGMYFLCQNKFTYHHLSSMEEHAQHTKNYLKISVESVYIDDEVDDHYYDLINNGMANGESLFVWFDSPLVEVI